jgi:hypothetical protein
LTRDAAVGRINKVIILVIMKTITFAVSDKQTAGCGLFYFMVT